MKSRNIVLYRLGTGLGFAAAAAAAAIALDSSVEAGEAASPSFCLGIIIGIMNGSCRWHSQREW